MRLVARFVAFCLAIVIACFAVPGGAIAQSDTGEILIVVTDATTGAPIESARTILVGPTTVSSLTTKAGKIDYTDAPEGLYRVRVVRSGYLGGASKEFEVLGGRSVTVEVKLAGSSTGGLKVIGSVTARSTVAVSSTDINDNSAVRRISDSLVDALDKIAGVTITNSSSDPDSAVTVSLNNQDESQTALTLDGIPLSAPGSAGDLRSLGTDLFSGSSVSFSPTAGSLAGGVNFRTLQPTQSLVEKFNGSTGTFDRSNYQISATGSAGALGFAVEHTWRGADSPLTYRDYADESGLDYSHEGESHSDGDYVKLRYRLSDERTTVQGTVLENNTYNTALCTQFVTLAPCGIGPGNSSDGRTGFGYLTVNSLVGTVATQLTGFTSGTTHASDDRDRFIDGVAAPSDSQTNAFARGVAASTSIALGRHTLSLTGNTYDATNVSTPIAGTQFQTAFTNATASTTYQFSDTAKSNDQLSLSENVSLANTTGAGTSVLAGVGAGFKLTPNDVFSASANIGSSQPGNNVNRSFSDPLSSRVNCDAGSATVSGPGDDPEHQSAYGVQLGYTRTLPFGQVTIGASDQVQRGQLVQALVSAASEPVGYLPAGYTDAIQQYYHQSTVCGSSPLSTAGIFVSEPIGGTRRLYRGFNLSGRFGIGKAVVVLPNYSLNVARLTAADARLTSAVSPTVVGEQLPGRPLHRGGLTIDGLVEKTGTELIANGQYTGYNNNQNIGSYIVASAGISQPAGPGRFTIFENNIFNTYGYDFSEDSFGRPLPLSGGGDLIEAGSPLQQRTINVSYSLTVGGPHQNLSNELTATRRGRVGDVASAAGSASPAPEPSGTPRGRLLAMPPPAGVDPLSLATTRDSCDAAAQADATPVLAFLKSYVAAYEAKTALPDSDVFAIVAHPLTGKTISYYLELRPKVAGRGRGGANGAAPADGAAGGGRRGSGTGGFGGGAGGGPGGEGGPPGDGGGFGGPPGGGPPGDGAPGGNGNGPDAATIAAFRNSPVARGLRGVAACAYVTALTSAQATADGIDVAALNARGPRSGETPGAATPATSPTLAPAVPPIASVPIPSGAPDVSVTPRPAGTEPRTRGQGGGGGGLGRRLLYVPGVGIAVVRPPELPQGGGSLKSAQ